MINIYREKSKLSIEYLIIFLFTLIPFIYIAGNAILDIVAVIISAYILSTNFKKILQFRIIIIFICYFFFISIISLDLEIILNTSIFLRFLLLFLFIILLVNEDNNFNNFFYFSFISVTAVSLVNFIQYFYPNIFPWSQINVSPSGEIVRVGGLFRNELISGSFLIYFLPFALIYFKKSRFNKFDIIFLILVFFGILFSGERSAFVSFLLFCSLYLLRDLKKNALFLIIVFVLITIIFYFNFYIFKRYTIDLYESLSNFKSSSYIGIFISTIKLSIYSLKSIFIGNGADTFAKVCDANFTSFKEGLYLCNVHPHNFLLEILFSFGFLPVIILIILFFKTIFNYFINFKNLPDLHFILFTAVIVFFMPLKTSGSIFQQRFGFIFFFYLTILVILNFDKKVISKYKT